MNPPPLRPLSLASISMTMTKTSIYIKYNGCYFLTLLTVLISPGASLGSRGTGAYRLVVSQGGLLPRKSLYDPADWGHGLSNIAHFGRIGTRRVLHPLVAKSKEARRG